MATINLNHSAAPEPDSAADPHARTRQEAARRIAAGEDATVVSAWMGYEIATIEQAWAMRLWHERDAAVTRAMTLHEESGAALDEADRAKQGAYETLRAVMAGSTIPTSTQS